MPPILMNLIVLAALALAVGLAIRSIWKSHKNGGQCSGNCSQCQGCRHKWRFLRLGGAGERSPVPPFFRRYGGAGRREFAPGGAG